LNIERLCFTYLALWAHRHTLVRAGHRKDGCDAGDLSGDDIDVGGVALEADVRDLKGEVSGRETRENKVALLICSDVLRD
jgi:hypothetical protein